MLGGTLIGSLLPRRGGRASDALDVRRVHDAAAIDCLAGDPHEIDVRDANDVGQLDDLGAQRFESTSLLEDVSPKETGGDGDRGRDAEGASHHWYVDELKNERLLQFPSGSQLIKKRPLKDVVCGQCARTSGYKVEDTVQEKS
jgi:hypothetical protein